MFFFPLPLLTSFRWPLSYLVGRHFCQKTKCRIPFCVHAMRSDWSAVIALLFLCALWINFCEFIRSFLFYLSFFHFDFYYFYFYCFFLLFNFSLFNRGFQRSCVWFGLKKKTANNRVLFERKKKSYMLVHMYVCMGCSEIFVWR